MFVRHQTLHISTHVPSTLWSMVAEASCCGDASWQTIWFFIISEIGGVVLQHDNDLKTQKWFMEMNKVKALECPSQSINPTRNLWLDLKRTLQPDRAWVVWPSGIYRLGAVMAAKGSSVKCIHLFYMTFVFIFNFQTSVLTLSNVFKMNSCHKNQVIFTMIPFIKAINGGGNVFYRHCAFNFIPFIFSI